MNLGKILLAAVLIAIGFTPYLSPQPTEAANIGGFTIPDTAPDQTAPNIKTILDRVITIFLGVLIGVAVIMGVYSGYLYLGAASDPKKLRKAVETLVYAAIAAGVGLLSFAIIKAILKVIGVQQNISL